MSGEGTEKDIHMAIVYFEKSLKAGMYCIS